MIVRIASGDEAALRDFYLLYEAPLFNFVDSILNDRAASYDIVNEVMLEVWRKAKSFEGRAQVRTWLFSIGRNKSIDLLRRKKNRSLEELEPEMPDTDSKGVEEQISQTELAQRMSACLGRLGASHREVLHLAFFEDLPQADIATVMGVPLGTVKSRMHHAKDAMRHCLGRFEELLP